MKAKLIGIIFGSDDPQHGIPYELLVVNKRRFPSRRRYVLHRSLLDASGSLRDEKIEFSDPVRAAKAYFFPSEFDNKWVLTDRGCGYGITDEDRSKASRNCSDFL